MIVVTDDILSQGTEAELRKWLFAPGAGIMLRFAEAEIKRWQAEAVNAALASTSYKLYEGKAEEALRQAVEWQTFLRVWDGLLKMTGPITSHKIQ